MTDPMQLSMRERQIMEVVYARGEATANDVVAGIADAPTRTTVRTILRILEAKGHLAHRVDGREFVYRPTRARMQVARPALRRLLDTFFGGSLGGAVAAYISDPDAEISQAELDALREVIARAKKKGR